MARPGADAPFVPNGESRRETAILLVGTADEYGIGQESIRATSAGFYITEELADLLYDESQPEPDPEPEPKAPAKKTSAKKSTAKKTSGNRAGKKNEE